MICWLPHLTIVDNHWYSAMNTTECTSEYTPECCKSASPGSDRLDSIAAEQLVAARRSRREKRTEIRITNGAFYPNGRAREHYNTYLVIDGPHIGRVGIHVRRMVVSGEDVVMIKSGEEILYVMEDDIDFYDDILADEDPMHAKRQRVADLEYEAAVLKTRISAYDAFHPPCLPPVPSLGPSELLIEETDKHTCPPPRCPAP